MSTTRSPAETLGQHAEAVSGKRMSWMDTAARLAPLAGGMAAVGGVAAGHILNNRQAAQQAGWIQNQLAQNQADAQRARQDRALARAQAMTNPDRINEGLIARGATPAGRRDGVRWTRPRFHRADL